MAVERLAYMITVAKPEISDKLAQVLWIRTIGNWVVPIYLLQSIGLPLILSPAQIFVLINRLKFDFVTSNIRLSFLTTRRPQAFNTSQLRHFYLPFHCVLQKPTVLLFATIQSLLRRW